jgi:Uncharacterised protein family (UPF0158)
MLKFSDLEDAFLFVSSAGYGMHSAVFCKNTGRILYRPEMGDLDEIGNEDLDWDMCIEIPHKNDFDLGHRLVFGFVESHVPDGYHRVQEIFRRRGAYGRFKDFLESKGLLQSWYDFENRRQEQALRDWCKEKGIEISD